MTQNPNLVADAPSRLTAWQRIETLVKMSGMSINAFARCIGLLRGENLYQIKKGNNGISRELARRIVEYYPQISFSWLMTGEGAMYVDDNGATGIPLFNCTCSEDIRRIVDGKPDGYVTMPGLEDCCAVIAHNWRDKDGFPEGAYIFVRRMENRYVRMGQYILIADQYAGACYIRTLSKTRKLKVTGGRVPASISNISREQMQQLYQIRGVLNVLCK